METEEARLPVLEESDSSQSEWSPGRLLASGRLPIFLVDLLVGAIAYALAWLVRIYVHLPLTQTLLPQERWDVVDHAWILLILSQAFSLYVLGMYDDMRLLRYRELFAYAFLACSLQVLILTSVFYLTNEIFPRSVVLIFGLLNFAGLFAWRYTVKRYLLTGIRRVLVMGETLESAREVMREIEKNPWMGLRISAVMVSQDSEGKADCPYPVVSELDRVGRALQDYQIDEVIFASRPGWKDEVLNAISDMQIRRHLRIAILPSVYEIAIGRLRHINIHDTPLIEVRRNPSEPLARIAKRFFDLFFSLGGIVLASPLFLIVAPAIRLSSEGPVFYLQDRVGRGGRIFRLIKFRTMVHDAERETGAVYARSDDPRVTGVGRFLRRFRLDELPQFLNVLKGDMSFVGPRPERPHFVRRLSRELPGYNERHKVKPGITGLAQVRGYYHTAPENKLKYDLAYIYNQSFSLDLLILLETLKVVLIRRGS